LLSLLLKNNTFQKASDYSFQNRVETKRNYETRISQILLIRGKKIPGVREPMKLVYFAGENNTQNLYEKDEKKSVIARKSHQQPGLQ